jgi:hypothetical protein
LRAEKRQDQKIIASPEDKEEMTKNSKIDYYRNSKNIVVSLKKDTAGKFT